MSDDKFGYAQLVATAASFGIASLGGVAALLHSGKPASVRSIFAAFLYSGVLGLVVFLVLFHKVWGADKDIGDVFLLLGVSGFAGIGGVDVVSLVMVALKGKFNINIGRKGDNDE